MTAADLSEYNGWAKIGCILLTMEDDLEAINEALSTIVQRLFFGCARGFLVSEEHASLRSSPSALCPPPTSGQSPLAPRPLDPSAPLPLGPSAPRSLRSSARFPSSLSHGHHRASLLTARRSGR